MLLCKAILFCMTNTVTLPKSVLSGSFLWQGVLNRTVQILCRLDQNCPKSGSSLSLRFDWGDYIQTPEFSWFGIDSACSMEADPSLSDHQLVSTMCGQQEGQETSLKTLPLWMIYVYFEFTVSTNRKGHFQRAIPSLDSNLKVGCPSWRSQTQRLSKRIVLTRPA